MHETPDPSADSDGTQGNGSDRAAAGAKITIRVVDGPHDGLTYTGTDTSVAIGRGIENSIELSLDPQVSRDHCLLRLSMETAGWLLEDRGSANGTWYQGHQISSPRVLEPEAVFVVGTSVIAVSQAVRGESFLPNPARTETAVRELASRLDPIASRAFGAAQMLALREGSPFLTIRHLFLGLVSANSDTPLIARGTGLVNVRFIRNQFASSASWTGENNWIAQLLATSSTEPPLFPDQLTTTPRVYRAFSTAESQAADFGDELITSNNLLFGLFTEVDGRLREQFLADGGDLKSLLGRLSHQPTRITRRPVPTSKTRKTGTDDQAVFTPIPRSKDTDPVVSDLSAAALRVASKYRFANTPDRTQAVKQIVTTVIAGVSADRRRQILEQLRDFFPLNRSTQYPRAIAEVGEQEERRNLQERISELENALATATGARPIPTTQIPWAEVLGTEGQLRTDRFRPTDASSVELVRDIVGFSIAIERFVIGIVAGLRQGSSTGELYSIPGHSTSIRRTINLCISGQPLSEEFKPYLRSLETWLVAAIAAYHSAPENWFSGYWKKTSPPRIEALVPAKFLSEAKCWAQYKSIVRRISPDLVGDEIQALVRIVAQRKFDELIDGRS